MAIKSIASVKSHFETGDRPKQAEFEDLIDTTGRKTPIAIASAAESGKTGLYEILGDADVTARETGAFGLAMLSAASTALAKNRLGISSVQSTFLEAETTASSRSLLGVTTIGEDVITAAATASAQDALGLTTGTVGLTVLSAETTASAQDVIGITRFTAGTAQAATSGTALVFTGIPSWVNQVILILEGVSTSGGNAFLVQLGTSGGFVTSGYTSAYWQGGSTGATRTDGFPIHVTGSGNNQTAIMCINRVTGDRWVATHNGAVEGSVAFSSTQHGTGRVDLSDTLTQLRLTTIGGTDTFDAGTVNIQYQ